MRHGRYGNNLFDKILYNDRALKKKKIHIVWLVNDKYVNNFITVYKECKKSKDFCMTVLAVPRIGYSFSPYISSKEIFDYLTGEKIECIDVYDEEQQKYFDIESLNPDYVFTTTPYDIYLPEEYRSWNLQYYAKLCNILYGSIMPPSVLTTEYVSNAYRIFTASKKSAIGCDKCVDIGCMKLDEYLHYKKRNKRSVINKKNKLSIAWKPRWTLNEDESTLVRYIEDFYQWVVKNQDVQMLFITHPMLEENAKNVGWTDYYKYMELFHGEENIQVVDSGDFMDYVMESDVFMADMSTTLIEFAITGKPVIYTEGNASQNELTSDVIENSYKVGTFEEIISVLYDLKAGTDRLGKNRKKAAKSYFTVPPRRMSVAKYLLKILKRDYKENPFIKKRRLHIGDMVTVNGFGSCSAWGEKDNNLIIENARMVILDIRDDGINKYGCGDTGNSNILFWVSEQEIL